MYYVGIDIAQRHHLNVLDHLQRAKDVESRLPKSPKAILTLRSEAGNLMLDGHSAEFR
jgi:hypothetical protein